MNTFYSLVTPVAPPAQAVAAQNAPAWRWGLALALAGALSQPAVAQDTFNSPATIQGGYDQWLQTSNGAGYHHLIGTYPGWDPGAIYLAGRNQTNNANDQTNKVVVGGYGSNLPLFVTGNLTVGGQSLNKQTFSQYLEINGNDPTQTNQQATLMLHHGGVLAHQLRYANGTLHLERAGNGYGTTDVPNFVVGGGISAAAMLTSGFEARRDAAGQVQLLTVTNRAASSAGTGTAIAFRGYRDVDPNYETGRIALMHVGGTAGDAAQFAHMIFSVRGFNDGPPQERMRITPGGNVLIAKNSQANGVYKLDVGGSVRANEVVVNTNGADFVFEKGYPLMPLPAVEAYIQAHHHLPEVASAAEMQTRGAAVGEVQTKLLQKVEELTLHLIAQDKRLAQLEAENQALKTVRPQEQK